MNAETRTCADVVAAAFSHDFVANGIDRDAVSCIHRGMFDEWALALAGTGLISRRTIALAVRSWQNDPRSLLAALLAEADEITVVRSKAIWDELDQTAPVDAVPVVEYRKRSR